MFELEKSFDIGQIIALASTVFLDLYFNVDPYPNLPSLCLFLSLSVSLSLSSSLPPCHSALFLFIKVCLKRNSKWKFRLKKLLKYRSNLVEGGDEQWHIELGGGKGMKSPPPPHCCFTGRRGFISPENVRDCR